MNTPSKKDFIKGIVRASVESFAEGFKGRHEGEIENPNGTLNMKIHNIFIAKLGPDIQYYSALVRSLDSSLGNMLEKMAVNIAKGFYEVNDRVDGFIHQEQVRIIADLLESYKDRGNGNKPKIEDYEKIRLAKTGENHHKIHVSDYYLLDKETDTHYLVELKIGGDLDNKKARSEKEAIFEQYAILSNSLDENAKIECKFATAYNRFGEGNDWKQERVKQFFSNDELLIGKDFWNFICKDENGFDMVIEAYEESAGIIKEALEEIKKLYLED
ncbi:MAG: TdeIII family type II restriction endonuclease [Candidatus Gracilibacteria bacterium]|nr:TdeIII family type II restriction endonuclease [Candidatus Gracilibacteria bacterium]